MLLLVGHFYRAGDSCCDSVIPSKDLRISGVKIYTLGVKIYAMVRTLIKRRQNAIFLYQKRLVFVSVFLLFWWLFNGSNLEV